MQNIFADEFREIPTVLAQNADLRNAVITLIDKEPIAGKATEGGDRLIRFKGILKRLVMGEITLMHSYGVTEAEIPENTSTWLGRTDCPNTTEQIL